MDMDFKWTTRAEKLQVVAYWWEQQRGLCCLCFKPMDPYVRDGNRNPNGATIEHLIPRRENGPNTVGNVRLAHGGCNHALGALWEMNKHRAIKGEAPLSEKWALNTAAGNRRAAEQSKLKTMTAEENEFRMREYQLRKARGVTWCAANALSLPRGATLPSSKIKRRGKPKHAAKMTAEETARWLRDQGIKGA
jgi:hypothetical protein